jgi:hypothetical protein
MCALYPFPEQLDFFDCPDPINPPHYTQGQVECIDAIKAALGDDGFTAYCRGAAIKYLWRAPLKNGTEDYQKAGWYVERLVRHASR